MFRSRGRGQPIPAVGCKCVLVVSLGEPTVSANVCREIQSAMVQDGSDALESRVDQMVTECVHGILFAVRAFLCFFPVVIFGPLVDWLTCWRFLVSARGLKYIWTGDVMGDRASLFTEGYVVTDGVFAASTCTTSSFAHYSPRSW